MPQRSWTEQFWFRLWEGSAVSKSLQSYLHFKHDVARGLTTLHKDSQSTKQLGSIRRQQQGICAGQGFQLCLPAVVAPHRGVLPQPRPTSEAHFLEEIAFLLLINAVLGGGLILSPIHERSKFYSWFRVKSEGLILLKVHKYKYEVTLLKSG